MLTEIYEALVRAFGHRAWWPAESPFEVMVGAVLTQNTNWQNVEKAIGKFLTEIEHVESVKVLYRKKRVSLIFEKVEDADGEYVVRYSDHRLNGLQRREFEKHMRDVHGITVLSTEKRFKRSA